MRVAVISDTHGNLPALEAVLAELDQLGPERIVMAGDFAFGGPWPAECIEAIRQRGIPAVRGNTDEFLVEVATGGARPAQVDDPRLRHLDNPALAERYRWCAARLSADAVAYLADLPLRYTVPAPTGAALTVVHATPWSAHPVIAPPSAPREQIQELLDRAGGAALAYGHIHLQAQWRLDGRLVVAVGSVGLPFDGDQRAAYALLTWDGTRWEVEFRRVSYPVERTIAALRTSDMPGAEVQVRVLETARPPGT
ncbi:metallophosphoesterase family protein [Thermomicrobium sp. 4228-Ro]|uniref:metallophosphoesterase family protein n=1 Tax=Thermomicrobium sp. 4228-Ro TaxID=2993937 RepID=UPI0022498ED9|nr:metallophosphoesterase family protein [Thermomicrobium sp. 4228-Ro]MCX2727267.1 metallophosphoesterase family protein [Thermomicrobium sp. 4228-Ro]